METNRQQQPCDATAAAHSRTDGRSTTGVSVKTVISVTRPGYLSRSLFSRRAHQQGWFLFHIQSTASERARRIFGASSCLLSARCSNVCVLSSSTHCMSLIIMCRGWNIVYIISLCRCCRVNYIAHAFLCNKAHRAHCSLSYLCVCACMCVYVNKNEVQCQRGKHNAVRPR